MSSTRRVIAALGAGLALTWSLGAPASAASPAEAAQADGGLASFHTQHLRWHACQLNPGDDEGQALDEAGAQCTEVTVPLDYARPGGRTITLALSRLPATDTAGRIGALVINLGGPAIPGLDTVPLAREAMGDTGARFDLVGLDRRFVGRSTPLDCALPASWIPRSAGTDRRSFDRMVEVAADVARRCDRVHGDLLAHASTADSARDLDVVRAALGERTLSYLGYSYGSYLGAVYAQLFPHRAGRIVLDSVVDPARPGALTAGRETGPVREAALRDWAGWAAARDDRYHLGGSADAVLATVTRIYQASARRPLQIGRFRVDDTVMPGVLLDPLSDDGEADNANLAATVQVLTQAATGGVATPTPALEAALTGLLTGARSPAQSAQAAILCADAAVPRDPRWYWRDVEIHRAEAPLFGPLNRDISPCAFWPVRAERPVRVHNGVPALVVNADGDINATYPGAVAMHRALSGSRLITLAGARTHGVYLFRGEPCVDGAVYAYLRTGIPPARDVVCT